MIRWYTRVAHFVSSATVSYHLPSTIGTTIYHIVHNSYHNYTFFYLSSHYTQNVVVCSTSTYDIGIRYYRRPLRIVDYKIVDDNIDRFCVYFIILLYRSVTFLFLCTGINYDLLRATTTSSRPPLRGPSNTASRCPGQKAEEA